MTDDIKKDQDEVLLTVVITCYNEQEFIVDTIASVEAALREVGLPHEVIVMDDCSRDASRDRILEYIARHPGEPVRLHANVRNRGLANNFVEGAFLGRGRHYRLCVGDNIEPVSSLATIFRCIGKADMILPYHNQQEVIGKTRARKRISRAFTAVVNFVSGRNIRYYNGCGVFLRRHVMRWPPISYGFGFQADVVTRLLDEGTSYMQVPARNVIDRKGASSSSVTVRNFLSVLHTLLEIAIRRVRRLMYHRDIVAVEVKWDETDGAATRA